jgi:PAS domain S-box-containing protein
VTDRPTLEETVALLQATLDATHDAILVVDLDGRIILFNRRYLTMFGFTAEELTDGGRDLVLAKLGAELENADAALAKSRELWADLSIEVLDVLRFKDGRVFERYVAPHMVGSQIVGRVASFRDIGSSVRAAEALEQHRAFLEQAQAVAHIGSWVAEMDGSGRIGWSAESHRIFGVPVGQFDGSIEAALACVHADDRDAIREAHRAAAEDGRPIDIEHRVVRPDRTIRWVHERAHILRDATGSAMRMIGTVQDVTDRRQLEDQLRQSQKMEAIGRLAGGIAHDLNNALTAIAGYSELVLGEVDAAHPARADVEEIRKAAERAGSVTRQLLAFSRKRLLEPRVFDLNGTITAIARLLSRLLGPGVVVKTRLADSRLPVLGDPGQVEQALINLAVNARDAMPAGGHLLLTTSMATVDDALARTRGPMPAGDYVFLEVSDSGVGMSRETQGRIFEPFFTTKDVGKGTGLGLSMVYGTMKQIGGFIFVDSEVDRGTTFRLYFPPAVVKPVTTVASTVREKTRRGRETLMIVEDEPAVRNLVASVLRHDGYQLLLASSAGEAADMFDAHEGPIDLLLTDAMLPDGNGPELADLMIARRPGLPVIIMTGYTEETLEVPRQQGQLPLLQKPFSPRELRRRIREALDG